MSKITVEHLKQEANSGHTYFTEFVLAYNKNTSNLYCFFEGYDDTKYYSIRIKNITFNERYNWFYCSGKENVMEALTLIKKHKEYNLNRILFFIDKDFSEKVENKYIYCTPYYSIENFYTTHKAIEAILKEEFKLIENIIGNNDYEKVLELYNKLLKEFHSKTLFFNAWLACQNDMRIEKNEKRRLHIDSKIKKYFKSIISRDLNSISDFEDLNNLKELHILFPEAYKIDVKQIQSKIKDFEKLDGRKYYRGKFELKFLISFIDRLKNELGKKDSLIFSKRYKINLITEYSTAISILSQYAETPECLKDYLNRFRNTA